MNIQLKQTEIETALSQYITNKGFDLSGKTVTIEFTAGRKAGGLIADIVIDDSGIPGFTDSADDGDNTKEAALKVVDTTKPTLDTAAIADAARNAVLEEDQPASAVAEPEPAGAVSDPFEGGNKPSLFS